MTLSDFLSILPLAVLVAWACALLLFNLFIPRGHKCWTALLAAMGLVVVFILTLVISIWGDLASQAPGSLFHGMIIFDGFSLFLNWLFLISGLAGVALAYDYLKRMDLDRGEYYSLLLFTIIGMMLMAMAGDLIVVFLALELLSIPLYVLSGFARPRPESEEAALKYFLLGAFSTGFIVYGIALVFGATGTTSIAGVYNTLMAGALNKVLLTIGAGLILIGLGFKVAVVPFHMWTPDVYQGAPSAVVAFMSVGTKAGGFAALLRIFITAFPVLSAEMVPIIWAIAALTMLTGNLLAIAQTNIKRLLAYSSIAHAGYIMMALVPFGQSNVAGDSAASALFYLLAYAFTNFAAWSVVIAMEKAGGQGLLLDDYAGLGRKSPGMAAVMTVAMLSFTGIPPTLGFMGKFYLFRTALEGGYIGLAIIGVLTSLISAYYYLRVVVIMYMREGEPQVRSETWLNLTAAVAALGTVGMIIFSEPLFNLVSRAILR